MLIVWSVLLNQFKDIIVKLQSVDVSLPNILDLCQSLIVLVANIIDNLELYEEGALEISVVKEYDKYTRQKRTQVVQADESDEEHTQFQGRDDLKVNTFLPILDRLYSAMCETCRYKGNQ